MLNIIQTNQLKELSSTVANHNPVPDFAKMTDQKIEKSVKLYDASGVKLPVLETIRSNESTPVLTKQQESILNLHERDCFCKKYKFRYLLLH